MAQNSIRMSRRSDPEAFIFLLDNVLGPGEEVDLVKGQWVRAERELEEIFDEAGVIVHSSSGRQSMPEQFRDVVVWALY